MNNFLISWIFIVCIASHVAIVHAADVPPQTTAPIPLEVTIQQALVGSLSRNRELRVRHLGPELTATAIDRQLAAFDPTVSAQITTDRVIKPGTTARSDGSNAVAVSAGIGQTFATGTTVSVDGTTARKKSDTNDDASVVTRGGLTINQALLQGASIDANLAAVHQAHIDVDISRYELRGFTMALVATVEQTYWDYALSEQQVDITQRAWDIACQQLDKVKGFIAAGKLAGVELAAAEAEVAVRNGYLIEARSQREQSRLQLLVLLEPEGSAPMERTVTLLDKPFIPDITLADVQTHIAVALRQRPDLNQARLQVTRGDLDVVRTRNGVLPRLDLFATLGRSGYASSFNGSLPGDDGHGWDAELGARFSYTLGNRDANASRRRALLSREQLDAALANQERLVEIDVRSAYSELQRAREQITATAATTRAQITKAQTELEKFNHDKSTALLVAQAERDALAARIDEVRAVVRYLKDLVDLYRLDGSLLERRGLSVPGGDSLAPAAVSGVSAPPSTP